MCEMLSLPETTARAGLVRLRLLELRFGPLADALRERIRSADAEALLLWSERILTAATPEDVVKE